MPEPSQRERYVALRIRPQTSAPDWWSAAVQRRDIPAAIAPLLRGRTRVEVTPAEAAFALAWAGGVGGWAAADPKPVFVHRSEPGGFDHDSRPGEADAMHGMS